MRIRTLAAAVTACAITGSPVVALAQPAPENLDLSFLATTDVHGHIYDFDYFTNQPYPADDALGLTHVSSIVKKVRADRGADKVFVFDNGDSIQGSPLTSYYANQENILKTGKEHPMATANNLIDYDVQVVGNHEFNYGLEFLERYQSQVDFPLVGANVIDDATGEPMFDPYTIVEREIDGKTVKVGVIGVTPPGSAVWDKQHLDGKAHFEDIVTSAKKWAPKAKQAGADVVVALAHSGKDPEGSSWDPKAKTDDLSTSVAREVPDIDIVIAGHSHQDEPEEYVKQVDGTQALVTQPKFWARSVSEVGLSLVPNEKGGFEVDWSEDNKPKVTPHYSGDAPEDKELKDALKVPHEKTIKHVNKVVGQATETMSAKTSRYEDTAIVDFISHVQADTVRNALKDSEYKDLPVISQASPFSRTAEFKKGDVTIRDVAGLYVYDNTLSGVKINGKQLREYLEWSARYFKQVDEGAEFNPEEVTNAPDTERGRDIPDYSYDAVTGVKYDINISKPEGERIENLRLEDGSELKDSDEFIMAINNYRASGGSGYPVSDLPEVYNDQIAIREAIVDWTVKNKTIDPKDFFVESWWLTSSTRPVEDEPGEEKPGEEKPAEDKPGKEKPGEDKPSEDPTEGSPTDKPSEDAPSQKPGDDSNDSDGSDNEAGKNSSNPLPRTGAQIGVALGVGVALLAAGAVISVATRRKN